MRMLQAGAPRIIDKLAIGSLGTLWDLRQRRHRGGRGTGGAESEQCSSTWQILVIRVEMLDCVNMHELFSSGRADGFSFQVTVLSAVADEFLKKNDVLSA
jgi:hypothetical protein